MNCERGVIFSFLKGMEREKFLNVTQEMIGNTTSFMYCKVVGRITCWVESKETQ